MATGNENITLEVLNNVLEALWNRMKQAEKEAKEYAMLHLVAKNTEDRENNKELSLKKHAEAQVYSDVLDLIRNTAKELLKWKK